MPFIGNQPALSYTSFAKQDFTTSATTSYTLDQPVANENEIALFINFVRQEPTTAYTASGTTLTLTSATSASDDMYCVFLGKAVQTVNPPNGSVGISQLSATGTKDSTTFLRGDNTFAVAGGTNTPAFQAKMSSGLTLTSGAWNKLNFNSEVYDIGGYYDTSTAKFTPPAGKYFVYYSEFFYGSLGNTLNFLYSQIYKNGSGVETSRGRYNTTTDYFSAMTLSNGLVIDLNGTDYLELYAYTAGVQTGSGIVDDVSSVFGAYKIIE